MDTQRANSLFQKVIESMFLSTSLNNFLNRPKYLYKNNELIKTLRSIMADETLSSKNFKTGLSILATSVNNYKVQVFSNHPLTIPEQLNIPIYNLLAAAVATPTYFIPTQLFDGEFFFDATISVGGDPLIYTYTHITDPELQFKWRDGRSRLFVFSLGVVREHSNTLPPNILSWLQALPDIAIHGAFEQSRLLFSRFEKTLTISQEEQNESSWAPMSYRRYESYISLSDQKKSYLERIADYPELLAQNYERATKKTGTEFLSIFDVRPPTKSE